MHSAIPCYSTVLAYAHNFIIDAAGDMEHPRCHTSPQPLQHPHVQAAAPHPPLPWLSTQDHQWQSGQLVFSEPVWGICTMYVWLFSPTRSCDQSYWDTRQLQPLTERAEGHSLLSLHWTDEILGESVYTCKCVPRTEQLYWLSRGWCCVMYNSYLVKFAFNCVILCSRKPNSLNLAVNFFLRHPIPSC